MGSIKSRSSVYVRYASGDFIFPKETILTKQKAKMGYFHCFMSHKIFPVPTKVWASSKCCSFFYSTLHSFKRWEKAILWLPRLIILFLFEWMKPDRNPLVLSNWFDALWSEWLFWPMSSNYLMKKIDMSSIRILSYKRINVTDGFYWYCSKKGYRSWHNRFFQSFPDEIRTILVHHKCCNKTVIWGRSIIGAVKVVGSIMNI